MTNKKIIWGILMVGVLFFLMISSLKYWRESPVEPNATFISPSNVSSSQPVCGNDICEESENCWTCPSDCRCREGEYCSATEKRCVKPVCGNSICEISENAMNCCVDCPCPKGYICNTTTLTCEVPVNLTSSQAVELLVKYLEKKGLNYTNMTILGKDFAEGKRAIFIRVYLENQTKMFAVTEDEEIIEIKCLC